MKITKKQRKAIIKEAKNELVVWRYLCPSLSSAIANILGVYYPADIIYIRRIFPEFKRTTAVKYFNAKNEYAWWRGSDKRNRLRFLNYLLNGKLPKVKK
jgi:hypothetical protein